MSTNVMRTVILLAIVVALGIPTVAQQNQNQNQNANPPQNQPAQQNQTAQPQPKKGFWQKVHDLSQAGQNVVNQGTNTVQQGRGAVQQTGQQVQGAVQQAGQQVQGGVQQIPNGMQPSTDATQGAASGFQGGGAGAGACGPSCFDAGPFQANVSQMTMSQEGGWHVIRMNIQFHNASNQPLVIAYHDGSMVMVDNNGNTYIPAGGNPGQLQGMGIDRGNQTDSQFQLGPGQTGYALFSVARGRAPNSPVGTGYSYNFTIDELQLQNGALAIPVRTYNLNFPSLAPGTSAASFGSGSAPAAGFVGNGKATAAAGTVTPQGAVQNVPGQRPVAAGAQQQRMVNGKLVSATPVVAAPQGTPAASVVNNAAAKTPVATPMRAQAPAAPAVKPNAAMPVVRPGAPAAKPATAVPVKKTPTTTTITK